MKSSSSSAATEWAVMRAPKKSWQFLTFVILLTIHLIPCTAPVTCTFGMEKHTANAAGTPGATAVLVYVSAVLCRCNCQQWIQQSSLQWIFACKQHLMRPL